MKNNKLEPKTEEFVKDETQFEDKKEVVKPTAYIITVDNLALRNAPDGERIGIAPAGHVLISDIEGDWGKLADNSGWVNLAYTRKVK